MRKIVIIILLLGALGGRAAAQQSRRPVKPEDTGPITVLRSATLQIPIDNDAVSVFAYLSDQQKLVLWFPDQAILEPRFGGKYHFRWKKEEGVWSGVVTEFVPANTLAFTWKPPKEDVETQVRFKLNPQGGQTIVELTLSGFTSTDALDKAVKGWVFNLRNLKSVIEDQTDLRQTLAKTRRPATHTATHPTQK